MRRLFSIGRKSFIACCFVPASFLYYYPLALWLRELCHPVHFFASMIPHADEIFFEAKARGRIWTWMAGFPLLLAMCIHQCRSVPKGLTRFWKQRRMLFTNDNSGEAPRIFLQPPGLVTLIPGLEENRPDALAKVDDLLAPLHEAEDISISEHLLRVHGKDDFAGCTVAVLAHWDKDGLVDPYVRHMMDHFHSLGWKVVLTSAGELNTSENTPGLPQADGIVCRTCPGYDFTSWKAALDCFPSLLKAEKLILCNDSVFGPIGSYATMHRAMDAVPCDFWGATASRERIPHLQSFYQVFGKTVLQHAAFMEFFNKVPLSGNRETAINFEVRLALWLTRHGLRPGAFISLPASVTEDINLTHTFWKMLIKTGMPMLKRELMFKSVQKVTLLGWDALLYDKQYPLSLLLRYAWRMGLDLTPLQSSGCRTGHWPPDVLALQDSINLDNVDPDALPEDRPPLGVFVHVFYPHLLPELSACLKHVPCTAHVYVSVDSEEKAALARSALEPLNFSHLEVRVLPNKGWDIAPFLVGFADVLEIYPLIVRLHAKHSPQLPSAMADNWRSMLFSALVGSKDRVRRLEALFANNPGLGLVCPPPLDAFPYLISIGNNLPGMQRLLKPYHISLKPTTAIDFPMGSMFWCRSEVLRPWLRQNLSFDDFEPTASNDRDGSLAHALERLFFFGCGITGLRWGRVGPVGFPGLKPKEKPVSPCKPPLLQACLRHVPFVGERFCHQENSPLVHTHVPMDSAPPVGLDTRMLPAAKRPELVLILPCVNLRNFSGGPNTALLFAAEVAKAGYDVHCLSQAPPTCSSAVLRGHLSELLEVGSDIASNFRVSCMSSLLSLHENDRLLATAWWTTKTARALSLRMQMQRFGYFIQDFEPLFYPWNEDHAGAMLSYSNDVLPVINEPSLAQMFYMAQPGRFVDSGFREEAQVFMPAVDRRHFHPEKRQGRRTLLFYARPSSARNLYHFGMEAISRLVRQGIITAQEWDVHCMGEDSVPPTDFGQGVVSRTLPWMGFADYAMHIRQASVGLSLMLSPHTSYMPLELAASGVPVLTTTYLNKTPELLRELSPLIIGVDPTIEAITEGLGQAVRMADQTDVRVDALKAPHTWHEAFAPIMPRFLQFMETGR